MSVTLVNYLLSQLKQLGVTDVFGVPGDYAFPFDDAIEADPDLRWIGCCNELNASYAADGYARVKGLAVLCTTFGVGELCAAGGIAGAYAEHLPIIHLVGMPPSGSIAQRRVMHHTLGTGNFKIYAEMASKIVCDAAVLTPENAVCTIGRVLNNALYHRRPVYLALPMDYANAKITAGNCRTVQRRESDSQPLQAAVDHAAELLNHSPRTVAIAGYLLRRLNLCKEAEAFLTRHQLPFVTMPMDKSVLSEDQPNYLGIYDGKMLDNELRRIVEDSDCILNIGAVWSDFNTGNYSARINPERLINVRLHQVEVGRQFYHGIEISDFLAALSQKLAPRQVWWKKRLPFPAVPPPADGVISGDYFYNQAARCIRSHDIAVIETGCSSMAMIPQEVPGGAEYLGQTLWGAIGWATPASFGAAIAAPERRVVLITGEGAHQMTIQEITQFCRFGLKPLIFVVNNDGYLIERVLSDNPNHFYNDLPKWDYTDLARHFGCGTMLTAKVTTVKEFDAILKQVQSRDFHGGAYIEVVTPRDSVPEMARMLHDLKKQLYS